MCRATNTELKAQVGFSEAFGSVGVNRFPFCHAIESGTMHGYFQGVFPRNQFVNFDWCGVTRITSHFAVS